MVSAEFRRGLIATGLATSMALGVTACISRDPAPVASASATKTTPSPEYTGPTSCGEGKFQFVESVRVIGSAKDGGLNAINTGGCADVLDISGDIFDDLAKDEGFQIVCLNPPKPNYQVEVAGAAGSVILSETMNQKLDIDYPEIAALPICDPTAAA